MKGRTIIKGGHLWDGLTNRLLPNGAILIENGRIRAAGAAAEILTAPYDELFDWPEATLMPGLIDSHTHLSMDASLDNYLDHMSDPVAVLTLRATAMMRKDLASGVTLCRCLGDKEFLDVACRHAVQEGLVEGPHLLVATRGIRAPQGHGFVGYPFSGPGEIRKAIKENITRGADFIKIYITGTLKGTGSLPSYLSEEEIRVAIEEAHDAGVRVASHCVGGIGLDWAIQYKLDTLEHAYQITDEQVEHLAHSSTQLVLTPGPILNEAVVRRLPDHLIQGHLDERDLIFRNMARCVSAGIPFALGTDGLHGELVKEIEFAEELGASRLQSLQAVTLHGARICGIEKETGSLEKGKRADVIAVEGNPFRDLSALRKIICVVREGSVASRQSGGEVKTTPHGLLLG